MVPLANRLDHRLDLRIGVGLDRRQRAVVEGVFLLRGRLGGLAVRGLARSRLTGPRLRRVAEHVARVDRALAGRPMRPALRRGRLLPLLRFGLRPEDDGRDGRQKHTPGHAKNHARWDFHVRPPKLWFPGPNFISSRGGRHSRRLNVLSVVRFHLRPGRIRSGPKRNIQNLAEGPNRVNHFGITRLLRKWQSDTRACRRLSVNSSLERLSQRVAVP